MAFAFTAVASPAIAPEVSNYLNRSQDVVALLLSETAVGLILGIGLRLFILALQMAGTIAATATSLSQLFGGAVADPQPALSRIVVFSGLTLAVISGLHIKVVLLIIYSYELFPIGQGIDARLLADWGIQRIAQSFELAFSLAAPFVIASTIYNLALGAINRAMPQLMVAFVGAPAITLGSLVLLYISLPYVLPIWLAAFDSFIANPDRMR